MTDDTFRPDELEAYERATQTWLAKWPNHCKDCGGWGGWSYTQKHDEGPGEPMFDVCEALVDGMCHRCGHKGLTDDSEGPCKECGWNYDDGIPL